MFRGVHPHWGNDAFPTVSDSPYFRKYFQTLWKIFSILPFPDKFFDFHPQKFLMTFFSHRPQILIFPPIFPVSVHFPPVSRKFLFPPYFYKFPPLFSKNSRVFTHLICVFRFPLLLRWCIYASHNARTGRPCRCWPSKTAQSSLSKWDIDPMQWIQNTNYNKRRDPLLPLDRLTDRLTHIICLLLYYSYVAYVRLHMYECIFEVN